MVPSTSSLLAAALLVLPTALALGHETGGHAVHHFSKRMLSVLDDEGVVNLQALANAETRIVAKYSHGVSNYKINFESKEVASKLRKRQNELFSAARTLEKRTLAKRAGSTGSITLTDSISGGQDMLYFGNMGIGTPLQNFVIDFDTGSADLWVPAPKSSSTHTKFSIAQSSSIETSTASWDIAYGTGSSSGTLARDVVSFGGFSYPQQIFALATTVASVIEALPVDGICGLAFSTIASMGAPTILENLITQGSLAQPLVSFYFMRARDSTTKTSGTTAGGQICVGCIDSSKYIGNLNYVSVSDKGYWEVPSGGIAANGQVVAGTSFKAAIDTGTTYIYVPKAVAKAFYASVGGTLVKASSGQYSVPCASAFTSIALVFGGVQYQMPLSDVMIGLVSAGSSQCLVGIFGVDQYDADGNNVGIVGDLFLKAAYTVYSYSHNGHPAVGFAVSSTSGTSGTTTPGSTTGGTSSGGSSSGSTSGNGTTSGSTSGSSSGSKSSSSSKASAYIPTNVASPVAEAPVPTASAFTPSADDGFSSGSSGSSGSVANSTGNANVVVAGGFTYSLFSAALAQSVTSGSTDSALNAVVTETSTAGLPTTTDATTQTTTSSSGSSRTAVASFLASSLALVVAVFAL